MGKLSARDMTKERVQKVFEKAEERKRSGRAPLAADWQAVLEVLLASTHDHLCQNPGRLVPLQVNNQDEWELYLDLLQNIDLPPDTHAVLSTPSFVRTVMESAPIEFTGMEQTRGDASTEQPYLLVISDCHEHRLIIQVSLRNATGRPGMDVYEDGNHLADYTYATEEECVRDLAKVPWLYLAPKGTWTKEQVVRYTENWFLRSLDRWTLEGLSVHPERSYAHHPELLDLTPLASVCKLLERAIPAALESLEAAIETTNELNEDMDPAEPTVTREGILRDDPGQCTAFAGRIAMEMDQHLDQLERLGGIAFPDRRSEEYVRALDRTTRSIYRTVAGRSCPSFVSLW